MEVYVVQLTDRTGNKLDIGYRTSLRVDTPVEIGYTFWSNHPDDDRFSGVYEVVGVIQSA